MISASPLCRTPLGFVIALLLALLGAASLRAEEMPWAKLDFGEGLSMEMPRHWQFTDEKLRERLKNPAEAVFKIGGFEAKAGHGLTLVAANAFTTFPDSSAALRLTFDNKSVLSQVGVAAATEAEIAALGGTMKHTIEEAMAEGNDPQVVDAFTIRREKLGKHQAIVSEYFRTSKATQKKVFVQVNLVYLGTRTVKLTMSYRESERGVFRPIMQAIRASLVIPDTMP